MKYKLFIGCEHSEEVHIYAEKKTKLIEEIIGLCERDGIELIGYREREMTQVSLAETYCFTVDDGRVYALTESGKWQLKCRLYNLEEMLPESFVKINQSCVANIKKIERFDASITGARAVCFKNGYRDYISRRNLKAVKERLGLK